MTRQAARRPQDAQAQARSAPIPEPQRSGLDAFQAARAELASLEAARIARDQIALARLELEAVLAQAFDSTQAIIGGAEAIAEVAGHGPADQSEIIAGHVSDIFVACAFQDLTAQRVQRLKRILDQLDDGLAQVGRLLAATRPPVAGSPKLEAGPALPGAGNDQEAVDTLMAGAGETKI